MFAQHLTVDDDLTSGNSAFHIVLDLVLRTSFGEKSLGHGRDANWAGTSWMYRPRLEDPSAQNFWVENSTQSNFRSLAG